MGDGSGSTWERAIGWTSVSVERKTGERQIWHGGANRGTVNFAEIMAYLQPLGWFAAREEERRKSGGTRLYRVHIVTDSEYCKNMGNSRNRLGIKNAALWAAFDVFRRQGFILQWHWIPRQSCALNRHCDTISRLARLLVEKYNLQERWAAAQDEGEPATIYELNPSPE